MSYRNVKRFQECGRLEKIWRYRWYLLIPFDAVLMYIKSLLSDRTLKWKWAWSIAIGSAQVKMRWWHTLEETREYLNNSMKMAYESTLPQETLNTEEK